MVLETEVMYETKWLKLKQATCKIKDKLVKWDFVTRETNVVTVICKSLGSHGFAEDIPDRYLLISQYRPSVDCRVLEFPAGLVDKGETAADAAVRELKEESCYAGEVTAVDQFFPKSAGLSDEKTAIVEIEIDDIHNGGDTELEDTEDIQTLWLTELEVRKLLTSTQIADGMGNTPLIISADVYFYFMRKL